MTSKKRGEKRAAAGPKRYRVLAGLSYPTDPEIINRIQAGESIPYDERGNKDVPAGAVVDDVPAVSVPWLLEQNLIELIEEVAG